MFYVIYRFELRNIFAFENIIYLLLIIGGSSVRQRDNREIERVSLCYVDPTYDYSPYPLRGSKYYWDKPGNLHIN